MQLNIEQKRIIVNKPNGHSLIKGVVGSGKTTVAVNKIPLLLRHYCPEKDDKVLMVTYNKSLKKNIYNIYDKIKDKINIQVNLFDEDNSLKLSIERIDDMLIDYFNQYKKDNNLNIEIATCKECKIELIEAINFVSNLYNDIEIIDSRYFQFIKEEIMWIKACNYNKLEEYQSVDRIGRISNLKSDGPQKLRKNSDKRKAIFEVLLKYNDNLKNINKVDFQDVALLALKVAEENPKEKYTHILIDESQDLTKVQLEFLKNIYNEKPYSSITFITDEVQSIYHSAWLIKSRSFTSLGYDMTGKSNLLSKNYRTTIQIAQAAFSLIDTHKDMIQKDNLVKPKLIDKQGEYPSFRNFENKIEEGLYIVNLINKHFMAGYSLKDIVIITRIKKQLKDIRKFLQAYNIPCSMYKDDDEIDFSEENVKLLTMHSVKGLEFKVVIIAGLNSKVMPLCSTKNEEEDMDMLEFRERKLLYVGMTRATERLFLTSNGIPSKFIYNIDKKYILIK